MLKKEFSVSRAETFVCTVYIQAPYEQACQFMQKYYSETGGCVSVFKTEFVFTGGRESGVAIRLINYPRFPSKKEGILSEALTIGKSLSAEVGNASFTVVSDDDTWFFTRKE